jgi:hypothetical protein
MRQGIALVSCAITLAISMPAAADSGEPAAQAAVAPAQGWTPSVNLFVQKPSPTPPSIDWNRRPSADQDPAAKPTVVCGMVLVPADPKIDPRMRVNVPDRGVTFTMRAVQPTICRTP